MSVRRHLKKILLMVMLFSLIGIVGFVYWLTYDLPGIDQIEQGMTFPSTRIFDRHGQLLYEISSPETGRQTNLNYDDIPQHCVNAFIAVEDANYWSHPGVDLNGILRALWINFQGGEVIAGGSTITQQSARLLLLDPIQQSERSLRRKLREMILALQLQSQYSKEDLLALYLNQVYFGHLAYGLEAAARSYFNKAAPQLSLAECALLAGMVQNPNLHDPLSHYENSKARQAITLDLMVKNQMIDAEQAQQAKQDDLQFGAVRFPIEAPHFVMMVWAWLEENYGERLYTEGLQVTTTLDLDWQRKAESIVQEEIRRMNEDPISGIPADADNAALVALNPISGEIMAMVGSPDYFNEEISGSLNAALAYRQPGSTLKPFTYALGMDPNREKPYTAATLFWDIRTPFVTQKLESYVPANYGLSEKGPVLLREALASSYNIPAVLALNELGVEPLLELLIRAGLHHLADLKEIDLSLTLGAYEVSLLELTTAYAVFPNGGQSIQSQFIQEIHSASGELLYQSRPDTRQESLIDKRVAYLITDILSDNQARQPSFGLVNALQIGRPAAAKTGTTTDTRDNWVVGYLPDLVVGVWVGNYDNRPMKGVSGITGAGPIWNRFMMTVSVGQAVKNFPRPVGIVEQSVCAISGLLADADCKRTLNEKFIEGTVPTEYDTFYQSFVIDKSTGKLATDATAPENRLEQVYLVLPQEAQQWARAHQIPRPPDSPPITQTSQEERLPRLLMPDPFTRFEITRLVPLESQRIRFLAAVPEETEGLDFILNGEMIEHRETGPWQVWWTLAEGRYDLSVVAKTSTGETIESEAIHFEVVPAQASR